ncbi:MAG: hypothetical protein KDC98_14165 [Planctomycetes bacterium]|nr:hypothetical protein [Planctomycetota bacterium]
MRISLVLVILAVHCIGQQPQSAALTADLFVPIRAGEAADEGTWAAGERFKVSFHDGFQFVPYLGPAYPHNLPFRWATESVLIGTREYVTTRPQGRVAGEGRFEYDLGDVVEAYEVSAAATEQTFTIPAAPGRPGDLVVSGRVTSPLSAPASAPAHAAVTFVGPAGEAVVEYGAATAVDASGRRFAMTTAVDGDRIRLTLPARAVAEAVFPLVVDPVILSSSTTQDVGIVDLASHSGSTQVFVVMTRIASASDHDAYAFSFDPGWTNRITRIADVATTRSCNVIDVCSYEHGDIDPGYFPMLVAYEQRYAAVTYLRVVPLDFPSGSGAGAYTMTGNSGTHYRNPHLVSGGSISGACLAYERVSASGVEVLATMFSTKMATVTSPLLTHTDLAVAGFQSSIQVEPRCHATGPDAYAVYFAFNTGSTSYIYSRGLSGLWQRVTGTSMYSLSVTWNGSTPSAIQQSTSYRFSSPRLATSVNHRLLTYIRSPRNIGFNSVVLANYDRYANQYNVTDTLHAGQTYVNGEIAIDGLTDIAMATYVAIQGGIGGTRDVRFERIGNDARVLGSVYSSTSYTPRTSSVAFHWHPASNPQHGQFDGVFTTSASYAARGQELRYDLAASQPYVVPGHAACGVYYPINNWNLPSLAGFEGYRLYLYGITPPPFAMAVVGFTSQNLSLTSFGMPSCFLHVNPITTLPGEGSSHPMFARLPLPNSLSMLGVNLLTQWFWSDATANSMGLVSGDLVRIHVR